jgi:hypothetical protein
LPTCWPACAQATSLVQEGGDRFFPAIISKRCRCRSFQHRRSDISFSGTSVDGSIVQGIWLSRADLNGEKDQSPYYCDQDTEGEHNNCLIDNGGSEYDSDCCKAWAQKCKTNKAFAIMRTFAPPSVHFIRVYVYARHPTLMLAGRRVASCSSSLPLPAHTRFTPFNPRFNILTAPTVVIFSILSIGLVFVNKYAAALCAGLTGESALSNALRVYA